ncbi:BQ5605_C013g07149 [Microbotryum silenes-dioicae]|uniref:BQ5605_C013g07149 protein n=1 Tax=Microbotryum silenes-dioicae TaxID=796604 RepID=A0A2X0LVP2_9BASI|nr:BQ5605_C013g07149 [Microbotryum silenes-dioicae]
MSTVLQPSTSFALSQLSNTVTPARGPASDSILAKSHAPPRAGAASTNSHSSSCSSSPPSSPKTSALSRSLQSTAASPSSSGIYAANAQSERVRIDLQRLEEAKRVESLRASFLSPPSSTHHTPSSTRNILVSSPSTGSSPDREPDRDGGDSSDGGSGGAPTCRSSSRGAGEGDQYRHSLGPVTASAGVGSTPISSPPPSLSSQQPSPDSVLASVLANMSLNADSPSNSALSSTPAVPETSSPTAPAKSPKRRSFLSKLAGAMDGVAHSNSTSTSSLANHPVKEEVVAQTRVDASSTRTNPLPKAPRRATSKDDLTLLIINSGVTELGMSIQEVNTILFEIQELRHTTSTINPSTSPHGSSPSSSTGTFHAERSLSNSLTSAGAGPIDHDEIYSHEAASLTTSISELDLDGSRSVAKLGATRTEASTLSEVDSALMRLQERLEALAKVSQLTRLSEEGMTVLTFELACPPQEYSELEAQISPFLDESGQPSGPAAFLASKWSTTILQYEAVQKDAEMLSEELKEDKWLVVFRTVSSQAEDMMRSLEKVLTQSHQFVWDIERRRPSAAGTSSVSGSGAGTPSSTILSLSSTSTPSRSVMSTFLSKSLPTATSPTVPKAYFGDPETMQPLLTSFIALHRSLHSKVKYYAPACDRVLKILGKGIADRSTKNGEVLRRFNEMKTRWRNLVERIARIEAEMQGVEEMLRDAAEPSSAAASPTSSVSTSRRPVSNFDAAF